MMLYNFSLEGSEATIHNAIEHAKHQDWQSIEVGYNPSITNVDFIETINGIEIWRCYGTDSYLFAENSELIIPDVSNYQKEKTIAKKGVINVLSGLMKKLVNEN